jgi:hypothetical protein
VPTGATGSHVGFVTDVDLTNGTFTLESGNSKNIYTTRKISCFSYHTPPKNVLSALTGNGVPSETAIVNALTGLPLRRASIGVDPPDPDDCSQGGLDTDNYEIQNDDGLQREPAPANGLDGARVCFVHLPPSNAPRFCRMHGPSRSAMSAFGGNADIASHAGPAADTSARFCIAA